jgi:hypothetical protein
MFEKKIANLHLRIEESSDHELERVAERRGVSKACVARRIINQWIHTQRNHQASLSHKGAA